MPNVRNQEMMENIKADLADVQAMWVIDACGLTVKEVEALRRSIRESGAIMKVYKNTIMRIALKELELPEMDSILEGPSAFVFCEGDVAAAAKAVTEFAKSNDNLTVKGGMMDAKFVTREDRRCHLRRCPRRGDFHQRRAQRARPGDQAGRRSEGRLAVLRPDAAVYW